MTQPQSIDFNALELLLVASGASWEAAEAHGAFCGRACLAGAIAIRFWVDGLVPKPDSADVLAQERSQKLGILAASTILSLEAGDMGFKPLLPDDDEPLRMRTAALVDWCHGFMQGVVAAGGADQGPQADALESEVVSEILDDFSEITKAGVGDDEGQEAEFAYVELYEYVRVSAQLVYDETAALRASAATAAGSA